MLAAYIGGFWPTLIVSTVALAVGQWTLVTAGRPPLGPIGIALFLAFAIAVAAAGGARKRYQRRAHRNAQRIAELQAQMIQGGRLNTAGELAASIAHELNQPLSAATNHRPGRSHRRANDSGERRTVHSLGLGIARMGLATCGSVDLLQSRHLRLTDASDATRHTPSDALPGLRSVSTHPRPISTSSTTRANEHLRAKLGQSSEPSEVSARVTTVYEHGDGGWNLVHRHADPMTTLRSAESLLAS